MDHRELHYLLPDYLRGRLDETERAGVEAHLMDCAECRSQIERFRFLFSEFDELKAPEPPQGYFQALPARIRQRIADDNSRSDVLERWVQDLLGLFRNRWLAPAAAATLAAFLFSQVSLQSPTALESLAGSLEPGELTQILLEESEQTFLSAPAENETYSAVVPDLKSAETLWERLVDEQSLNDYAPLSELSDAELDIVLKRLNERTIL